MNGNTARVLEYKCRPCGIGWKATIKISHLDGTKPFPFRVIDVGLKINQRPSYTLIMRCPGCGQRIEAATKPCVLARLGSLS